jgi:hypothetical protein
MMRRLTDDENRLVMFLLGNDVPSDTLVEPLSDGNMGSLRFGVASARKFGSSIVSATFNDIDGVPVSATLNVDQFGELFELDVLKADFSPLRQIPPIAAIRFSTLPRGVLGSAKMTEFSVDPMVNTVANSLPSAPQRSLAPVLPVRATSRPTPVVVGQSKAQLAPIEESGQSTARNGCRNAATSKPPIAVAITTGWMPLRGRYSSHLQPDLQPNRTTLNVTGWHEDGT